MKGTIMEPNTRTYLYNEDDVVMNVILHSSPLKDLPEDEFEESVELQEEFMNLFYQYDKNKLIQDVNFDWRGNYEVNIFGNREQVLKICRLLHIIDRTIEITEERLLRESLLYHDMDHEIQEYIRIKTQYENYKVVDIED